MPRTLESGGPPTILQRWKLEFKEGVQFEAVQLEGSQAGRQESHLAVGLRGLTPKT